MAMDSPYYIKTERHIGGQHPDADVTKYTVTRSGYDDLCECDTYEKARQVVCAMNNAYKAMEGR